jgi:hypothetical protein
VPGGMVHAVMGVDPGGTTGLAACHVELRPTLRETLTEGMRMRKAIEVRGDWHAQARTIADVHNRFMYTAQVDHGIGAEQCHLVFENYIPDPHRIGRGATDLTSVWVMAAAVALIGEQASDLTYQSPSEAKGFAKNDRLRLWGLWEVGSEHKRDAMRHVARRLNDLVV